MKNYRDNTMSSMAYCDSDGRGCVLAVPVLPPPPPPLFVPPELPDPDRSNQKHGVLLTMIVLASLIGGAFIFCVIFSILRKYYLARRNPRWRNAPILTENRADFHDEHQEQVTDHHVWLINRVGLQQSVIDSITMFKYNRDEGLVEGRDCSVCLSEFQEDECLRLLPKCSHAFHVDCIDTWLRSHKNCPLCRAPIVSDAAVAQSTVVEPNSNESSSSSGSSQVNLGENLEASEVGVESVDDNNGRNSEILNKTLPNCSRSTVANQVFDEMAEIQAVRRSVSLDLTSASTIYQAVENIVANQGNSDAQLLQVVDLLSRNSAKIGSKNSSIYKLALRKGNISMKRSFSFSRKVLSFKHYRSRSSILPL